MASSKNSSTSKNASKSKNPSGSQNPPKILIGAHVAISDPVAEAQERSADVIGVFLSNPRGWRRPARVHRQAETLTSSDLTVYAHAPYLINVCSGDAEVREKSIQLLGSTLISAASVGAAGVVVHGGQATDEGDTRKRWKSAWKQLAEIAAETEVPLLIENTAGGDHAAAAHPQQLIQLISEGLEIIGDRSDGTPLVGACVDTCHGWAAGWTHRAYEHVGPHTRLLHVNGSKDRHGSRRDRHANLSGEDTQIGEGHLETILRATGVGEDGRAGAVIVETPGGAQAQADDVAWLRRVLDAEQT